MLNQKVKVSFKSTAAALVAFGLTAASTLAAPVKNIVLVHGAWVDGSGWKPVYEILVKDGYNVTHRAGTGNFVSGRRHRSQKDPQPPAGPVHPRRT